MAFASRTLERRYSQIEKGYLALVFGCTRFEHYLHDHDMITAVTDNKLLETILAKSINSTPKRLQGLMLRLIDMVIEFLKRILMKHFELCGLKYLLLKRKILFVVSAGSTTHRNVFRNTLKKQWRSSLLWVSGFAFSVILTSTF